MTAVILSTSGGAVPRYANGRVPYSALVKFGSGPDSITGTWEWWLSPGSLAKWRALVVYCQTHYNWTPRITAGWNAYRPIVAQQKYREHYASIGKPLQAAYPGTSSHGGNYGNRDSLAVDVGNYGEIGFAKFAAACKATGWATNVVVPQELWHIVDFDPWAAAPADTGTATPIPTTPDKPPTVPEEEDMAIRFGHRKGGSDEWMIVGPDFNGGDGKQLGYLVTTSPTEARAWGRIHSTGQGAYHFDVVRDEYIEIQDAARREYAATHKTA